MMNDDTHAEEIADARNEHGQGLFGPIDPKTGLDAHGRFKAAKNAIDGTLNCNRGCCDDAHLFIRDHLDRNDPWIPDTIDYPGLDLDDQKALLKFISDVWSFQYGGRDTITDWALSLSLCPIHFCDWAICFDDNASGCEQIRTIYPGSHDT